MAIRYDEIDQELAALTRLSGGFEGKRVLEVGCGNGRITRKMAPFVSHLDAIDPNEEKIKKAIEWAGGTAVHVHYHATALDTFESTEPYDVILLSWSL